MKNQKIGVIIQARMGSTRLPGKILKTLFNNETVLDVLIKRLKLSKQIDEIIIATTPKEENSVIIDKAKAHNISFFIGDENNVLKRYYDTAKQFKINLIVRITSDCPFTDPKIIDDMIHFYLSSNYDYIRNVDGKTNFPIGVDVEIFSFKILEKIYQLAESEEEKEHVTKYILNHPEQYSIFSYNDRSIKLIYNLRLTVDYEEDLLVCRKVFKKLRENNKSIDFSLYDVINIVENNPEIMDLNKHIKWRDNLTT